MKQIRISALQLAHGVLNGSIDPANLTPRRLKQLCAYIVDHNPGWVATQTLMRNATAAQIANADLIRRCDDLRRQLDAAHAKLAAKS